MERLPYTIAPSEYHAHLADVEVTEGGNTYAWLVGSSRQGNGQVRLERGSLFDINKQYHARLYVNHGRTDGRAEVESEPFELPLRQKLIEWHTRRVRLATDIDVVNERACQIGADFGFALNEAASVTLKAYALGEASPVPTGEAVILASGDYPAGDNTIPLAPGDLLPRSNGYLLELAAISLRDPGLEEVVTANAIVTFDARDALPVGHVIVKGVNVKSGRLVMAGQGIAAPGRGPKLAFKPVYSSGAAGALGALGINWTHNYDAALNVTPCGDVVLSAGDAGSVRFLPTPDGKLVAAKGYHGTLIANPSDRSFDFYSKDGTRHHFEFFELPRKWKLTRIADPNGNTLTLSYEAGRGDMLLMRVADGVGRALIFTYESRAFGALGAAGSVVTSVTGPGGMQLAFDYDDYGNLVASTRESGAAERYAYTTDAPGLMFKHNLSVYRDPNEQSTRYVYAAGTFRFDAGGVTFSGPDTRIAAVTAPDGGVTSFAYSGLEGQETTVTGPTGSPTTYTLNRYGSPLAIADAAGTVTMNWADDDIVMTSKTDANGNRTTYEYDGAGNLVRETAGGYRTSAAWLIQGSAPYIKNRPLSRTDRNGHTTTYDYDSRGNLLKERRPIGALSYTVATNGDRLSATDGNGHTTRYRYDAYGQLEATVDPLGGTLVTTHDARGNLVSLTDAEGRTTTLAYDDFDHLESRRAPNGTRTYQHDVLGNKLSETDEDGRTTTYEYDALSRPVVISTPAGTKSLSYDLAGNKIAETDRRGNRTTYDYDGAHRLVARHEPEGKTTAYRYDGNGNLTSETDANGHVTAHAYDALNRRTATTDALDGETAFAYDANGNRTGVTDAAGRTTAYIFDALDRLIEETHPDGAQTRNTYDANGNLTAATDANGHITRHEYDGLNRRIRSIDPLGHLTRYDYDRVGNLLQHTNARLKARKYAYDEANRRIRAIDEEGHATTYRYSDAGDLLEERWPNGNVLTFEYDSAHRRTGAADRLGVLWRASFDADGNRISETDANGHLTRHDYDALSRRTKSRLPENRTLTYGYDAAGNLISETDANGHVTTHEYDALNRRIKSEDALGTRWAGALDAAGDLISETDADGHIVTHQYDAHHRRIGSVDALGTRFAATFDAAGNKVTETDANGTFTEYRYDARNRLLSATRAEVVLFRHTYDEAGNVASTTDANGNKSGFEYDGRNLVIAENRPLAAISKTTFDAMGDATTRIDPEGRQSTYAYDLRRRLTAVTDAAGAATGYTYDGAGNRVGVTRPLGHVTTYQYDAAGRLTGITTAAGAVRLAYDANGNLLSRTDAAGRTTAYAYDARSRRTGLTHPDGAKEITTYDGRGHRTSHTDARGNRIAYVHDARGRETESRYEGAGPDGLAGLASAFDGNGNRIETQLTDAAGVRSDTYTYDAFDRLVSHTDPWGATVTHSYDAAGNRTATHAGGTTTGYRFDALNRRIGLMAPGGAVAFAYDRSSLPTTIDYPDGSRSRHSYDSAGRVSAIEHRQGATLIARSDYRYDANGNRSEEIVTEGSASRTTTYGYDAEDRLIRTDVSDAAGRRVSDYTLDATGNRRTQTHSGSGAYAAESYSRTYTLNARGQVVAVDQSGGATPGHTTYRYDADGNLTSVQGAAGELAYAWNARGELVEVRRHGTPVAAYRYDAAGLRQEKASAGAISRTQWIEGFAALDRSESGSLIARYEAGPNGRSPVLLLSPQGSESLHADALGSVTHSTAGGSLLARTDYGAWGNALTSGASRNKFGYTGHQPDAETGLVYFKARYYDPRLGRFISEDAWEGDRTLPVSWAKYLYANGNPLVYIDRDGESATLLGGVGGFFWGFGQMIGAEIRDALHGNVKSASDYLGVWGQNIVAGAQLGLSVDLAVVSGGMGVALSGAAGNAGLGAITVGGRGASGAEFAKQQAEDAVAGALLGGVLSKAAPLIGKAATAIAERTPAAVKQALQATAERAAGLYESSGAARWVATAGDHLQRALVKEGGKKELVAQAVPGGQKSVVALPSRAERQVVADVPDKIPASFYDDLAAGAARNPDSGKVVLGKFLEDRKSYTKVGAHYEATYLKLDNWRDLSKAMSQEDMWKVNESFLRQQITQGKQIFLSHDPAKATGFFAREVDYLEALGYAFTKENWVWKAKR